MCIYENTVRCYCIAILHICGWLALELGITEMPSDIRRGPQIMRIPGFTWDTKKGRVQKPQSRKNSVNWAPGKLARQIGPWKIGGYTHMTVLGQGW